MEEGGRLAAADPELISDRALERGLKQVGTLGSGNHFLEIGRVEEIYLPQAADTFGLFPDQVVILIHTGSRGLGYQTCEDSLKVMNKAMSAYGISLPDRQLACTPIQSPEGQDYLAAMAAAANYAWANRQVIMSQTERAFMKALGINPKELGFALLYDVCHNIAKIEEHTVDGASGVCVCIARERRAPLLRVIHKFPPTIKKSANRFSFPATWDGIRICWSELRARWKKLSAAPATAPAE